MMSSYYRIIACILQIFVLKGLVEALSSVVVVERKPLQVVIDIDDTIKSSGNVRLGDIALGGIDGQYSRGAIYPGVFDFVRELAQSHGGKAEPAAVLTARAREFKFALELDDDDHIVRGFKRCARRNAISDWGIDSSRVMYGSAHEWIFQDFKAWRKFANFQILAQSLNDLPKEKLPVVVLREEIQPKREYIFVGDTGEMDRLAGEMMLSRYPNLIKYVFLHCVSESIDGSDVFVPVDYAVGNHGRVIHFRTYVGAAFKACKAGLIDRSAFDRIVSASLADLDAMGISANNDPRNQLHDVLQDLKHARSSLLADDSHFLQQEQERRFHSSNNMHDDYPSSVSTTIDVQNKTKLSWWERPFISRFLNVQTTTGAMSRRGGRSGLWRQPFRLWRHHRRRRRLRREAKNRESALASAEL
mmetsp:Transcript_14596/g.19456  ORF Transcript_14596/g.19456 Transcript_14596/m.19456 type:complete len:416 (-) Transcript_14596:37-1284(-)